ncbi:MAG: alpha/beta hydrolase [Alphaproteobacteria bacterium]|nr:alpha/beta hydrolase [Alphaproteobacteria bacterium]
MPPPNATSATAAEAENLARLDGATIAYHRLPGRLPGIVFLGGFRSDMTGTKPLFLEEYCRENGRAFLRFDYFGHGQSSGEFVAGTIGRWAEDAIAAIDSLTQGSQILVGSSMGGWIMVLAALARPQRIAGLVGIAAAPDFTEDLVWPRLDQAQRRQCEAMGQVVLPSDYEPAGYCYSRALFEDGRRHLVMRDRIPLDCPVRLLHGMRDEAVPWQTSLHLAERLTGGDVWVTLVKDGDHRLSREQDLARLAQTLDALLGTSAATGQNS